MALFKHADDTIHTIVAPVPDGHPPAEVWENAVFHDIRLPSVVTNDQIKDIWANPCPPTLKIKNDAPKKTKVDQIPLKKKVDEIPRKTKGVVNPLKGPGEKVVLVCSLCKNPVKQPGNFKSGRFGMLENCNHVFCLSCIRFHRLQFQKKNFPARPDRKCDQYPILPFACPVCNAKSSCIASSYMYISEIPLKNMYMEQFKMEMALVPCQWMKIGQGVCAYPNDCCGRADLGNVEISSENSCTVA